MWKHLIKVLIANSGSARPITYYTEFSDSRIIWLPLDQVKKFNQIENSTSYSERGAPLIDKNDKQDFNEIGRSVLKLFKVAWDESMVGRIYAKTTFPAPKFF